MASGMGGLGFDSRQVEAGTVSPTTRTAATFFRSCVAQALCRGYGPASRYTLQRNSASTMKLMIFWILQRNLK